MNVFAWNGSIAGGKIMGGNLLGAYDPTGFSWALTVPLVIALMIAGPDGREDLRQEPGCLR